MKTILLIACCASVLPGLTGCTTERTDLKYAIIGALAESSSNPVPVKNLTINAYQSDGGGLFGRTGIDEDFTTNDNGVFTFFYSPFESGGELLTIPIVLQCYDDPEPERRGASWGPIGANKDTTLGVFYLYKKVEKFVCKIQFDTTLVAGDSVQALVASALPPVRKTFYGPIPSGTVLELDTIFNYKLNRLHLADRTYSSFTALIKPGYQKDFNLILPERDEALHIHVMRYK